MSDIPLLNIWFKKYNNGVPVGGHAARCYAIATEWRKRGGRVRYFPKRVLPRSVTLQDGTNEILGVLNDLSIHIADTPSQASEIYTHDILVCPHPGAEFEKWNFNGIKLLGPRYFPRRPEFDKYKPQDGKYTLTVPGGNKKKFYELVNLRDLPGPKLEVSGHSPDESARLISSASVVICSASTVAMEAMSLGKPTFIIKTSDDQELLYKWLPQLGAYDYKMFRDVGFALGKNRNNLKRRTYLSRLCIPSDGVKNLVDAILAEWNRKNGTNY